MTVRHALLGTILLGALVPGIAYADQPPAGPNPGSSTVRGDEPSEHGDDKAAHNGNEDGYADGKTHKRAGENDRRANKDDSHGDEHDHAGAADHRHEKSRGAPGAAHNSNSRLSLKGHQRRIAPGTGIGVKSMAAALLPGSMPNNGHPEAGLPVAANAVARHSTVQAGMGAPTMHDPKRHELVVIGGTPLVHDRHF